MLLKGDMEIDPSRWIDPFEVIRAEEVKGLVWQAIGSLSFREREVLVLHDLEGWDFEEIAAVVKSRTGTVHTRLSRARDSFEDAVAALVLMRRGRQDCSGLSQIIEDVGGSEFTSVLRLRILRHLRDCEICGQNRRRLVSAAELLGALAPLPLALAARERILANWNSNGTAADAILEAGQSPSRYQPGSSGSCSPRSLGLANRRPGSRYQPGSSGSCSPRSLGLDGGLSYP